ncbi:MAG: tetratricopeptide (TPR) repeat protein [Candidatus Latescibacterota bacterium]
MKRLFFLTLYLCACNGGEPSPNATATTAAPANVQAARTHAPTSANLSPEEKEHIKQFWLFYRQATQLRVQGHWQRALPIFRQALALDPTHEDGLYYLGNALFETGHYTEAASHWEQLISVNPRSTRAHLRLGSLFSSTLAGAPFDLERAEREVRTALAMNKEESGTVLKLGEILLLKGDIAGAQTQFAAASRTNARSSAAFYLLGYTHWQTGNRQEALALLRTAITLKNSAPRSHSASNEGDTLNGPMLAAGIDRGNIFAAHLAMLKPETTENDANTQREYGELAAVLADFGRE